MRIGLLAKRAGISTSCIRFYETRGLLPQSPRAATGYRDYDDRTLEIIRFVVLARDLGFSLTEIGQHLASPKDDSRKARLLAKVEEKLRQLDDQAATLARQRGALSRLVGDLRDHVSSKIS